MLVIKIWTRMLPWLETLNTYKLLSWSNGQIFTFSVNRVVIFGLLSEQRVYCQQQLLFPIFQVSSSYFESLPKNIWTPIKRLLEQHLVSMIISSSICQLFLWLNALNALVLRMQPQVLSPFLSSRRLMIMSLVSLLLEITIKSSRDTVYGLYTAGC